MFITKFGENIMNSLPAIVLLLCIVYIVYLYNALVKARQYVQEGASDIDTQLKRRYDLIPNLLETVKGYAKHEKETFEQVIKARTMAMGVQGVSAEKSQAENNLSGTLKTIFALGESYPDLKANQNFIELQQELSDTEDKIQASRRFYNSTVLSLNNKVETFPSNIIAKIFNFQKAQYFELDEQEKNLVKQAPKISF